MLTRPADGEAGDVLEELSERRGEIESVDNDDEACSISARIPLATIIGYEGELRWRTGERATVSIQFKGYEPCNLRRGVDDDLSAVRMPRKPAPNLDDSSIALPEPDEDGD